MLVTKPAEACSRDEIVREVWAQLEAGLNQSNEIRIRECDIIDKILDPDIQDAHPEDGGLHPSYRNLEPLLVAEINSGPYRPEAATRIHNLFLAADYVRTNTQLPSMEAANEAARRAVNAIIDAAEVAED